jgi:hypothetical protein
MGGAGIERASVASSLGRALASTRHQSAWNAGERGEHLRCRRPLKTSAASNATRMSRTSCSPTASKCRAFHFGQDREMRVGYRARRDMGHDKSLRRCNHAVRDDEMVFAWVLGRKGIGL